MCIRDRNIPNDQARAVRQREKNTIYRPRIEDGLLVPVEVNQLRQLFKVKKSDKSDKKVIPVPSIENDPQNTADS